MKIVDWRGVRRLMVAKQTKDDADEITYDTPFALCGVSTLSKSTETSNAAKYYDNVPAIIITGKGADEVAIDGSAIGLEERAKIIEGEPEMEYHALGYLTKRTDGEERYVWRLTGTFSYPEDEHNTEDDGTDSNGNSITYTGVNTQHKFTKTGKTAKACIIPASKYTAGEDAFFENVQTPDTILTT